MSPMGDAIFVVVEIVLILFIFIGCSCTTWLRGEARENEQQGQHHPPVAPPPRRHQRHHNQHAPRDEETLRAPVVLANFPYAAARGARTTTEPPAACAICLDELRQGQLCSEAPACRHIFHEGARLVLPGAAYGVAAADDMV
nr:unnamed protein product [Digitaria exilis]